LRGQGIHAGEPADLLQGTLEVHAVQALVELEHVALGAAGMAFPQASLDVDGHAGLSVVVEWAVGAPLSAGPLELEVLGEISFVVDALLDLTDVYHDP